VDIDVDKLVSQYITLKCCSRVLKTRRNPGFDLNPDAGCLYPSFHGFSQSLQTNILYIGILWWLKCNTYIETVNTTELLLSRHVSVLIGPSSGDVHISKL
jgi:hypothetical protein